MSPLFYKKALIVLQEYHQGEEQLLHSPNHYHQNQYPASHPVQGLHHNIPHFLIHQKIFSPNQKMMNLLLLLVINY
jgi:hypothetical protein